MSKPTKSTKSVSEPVQVPAKVEVAPAKKGKAAEAAPVVAAPAPAEKAKRGKSVTDSAVVSQLAPSAASSDVEGKVRRVINNEEIEKLFDEISKDLEDELQLVRDDKNHSVGIRFLRSICRKVKSLKADSFRLLSRKVKKTTTRAGNSGFMKNVKISPEMTKFCGFKADQLMSRVDVTKSICEYVKNNNLQNQADRRQFMPDDKLAKLLGTTEMITYYTLQKHIQKHFPKA